MPRRGVTFSCPCCQFRNEQCGSLTSSISRAKSLRLRSLHPLLCEPPWRRDCGAGQQIAALLQRRRETVKRLQSMPGTGRESLEICVIMKNMNAVGWVVSSMTRSLMRRAAVRPSIRISPAVARDPSSALKRRAFARRHRHHHSAVKRG